MHYCLLVWPWKILRKLKTHFQPVFQVHSLFVQQYKTKNHPAKNSRQPSKTEGSKKSKKLTPPAPPPPPGPTTTPISIPPPALPHVRASCSQRR
jgi:hypothetical protein